MLADELACPIFCVDPKKSLIYFETMATVNKALAGTPTLAACIILNTSSGKPDRKKFDQNSKVRDIIISMAEHFNDDDDIAYEEPSGRIKGKYAATIDKKLLDLRKGIQKYVDFKLLKYEHKPLEFDSPIFTRDFKSGQLVETGQEHFSGDELDFFKERYQEHIDGIKASIDLLRSRLDYFSRMEASCNDDKTKEALSNKSAVLSYFLSLQYEIASLLHLPLLSETSASEERDIHQIIAQIDESFKHLIPPRLRVNKTPLEKRLNALFNPV